MATGYEVPQYESYLRYSCIFF